MNVNFGLLPPLDGRPKKADRKKAYTDRARAALKEWLAISSSPRPGWGGETMQAEASMVEGVTNGACWKKIAVTTELIVDYVRSRET